MNEPTSDGVNAEGKTRLNVTHWVMEGLETIWDLLTLVLGDLL